MKSPDVFKNERRDTVSPAIQKAKDLLSKYTEQISSLEPERDKQKIGKEQFYLGSNETPEQMIEYVKTLLSSLEAGDPMPAMRFIKARSFNIKADEFGIDADLDEWEKVLADLEKEFGEVKPVE